MDEAEDIWLRIAADLSRQPMSSGNEGFSLTLPSSTYHRDRPSPTPHINELLSLLDDVKLLHRMFFVIRLSPSAAHASATAAEPPRAPSAAPTRRRTRRFSIPYLSAALHTRLQDLDAAANGQQPGHSNYSPSSRSRRRGRSSDAAKVFRDAMAQQLSGRLSPSLSSPSLPPPSAFPLPPACGINPGPPSPCTFWQIVTLPAFMNDEQRQGGEADGDEHEHEHEHEHEINAIRPSSNNGRQTHQVTGSGRLQPRAPPGKATSVAAAAAAYNPNHGKQDRVLGRARTTTTTTTQVATHAVLGVPMHDSALLSPRRAGRAGSGIRGVGGAESGRRGTAAAAAGTRTAECTGSGGEEGDGDGKGWAEAEVRSYVCFLVDAGLGAAVL
ncbi:hypothetical protein MBLNU459_g2332t1 [Dothideomycetes sp. NU459]